jgi:hypothetical protein
MSQLECQSHKSEVFKVSANPVPVIREGDESGRAQRHELPKKEAVRDREQAVTVTLIMIIPQATVHKINVLSVRTSDVICLCVREASYRRLF